MPPRRGAPYVHKRARGSRGASRDGAHLFQRRRRVLQGRHAHPARLLGPLDGDRGRERAAARRAPEPAALAHGGLCGEHEAATAGRASHAAALAHVRARDVHERRRRGLEGREATEARRASSAPADALFRGRLEGRRDGEERKGEGLGEHHCFFSYAPDEGRSSVGAQRVRVCNRIIDFPSSALAGNLTATSFTAGHRRREAPRALPDLRPQVRRRHLEVYRPRPLPPTRRRRAPPRGPRRPRHPHDNLRRDG